VQIAISSVEQVSLEDSSEMLGPGETLVASCTMDLQGGLRGRLLLVFEDRSGLALVDMLLGQSVGTTLRWGDLERSAAKETANIVGCAYLNALASHLPNIAIGSGQLKPGPPLFRHEFAATLLEFALMEQAMESDQMLLLKSRFTAEDKELDWSLLFIPNGESSRRLFDAIRRLDTPAKNPG
jgi:chemotaxis protein CheC